MTDLAIGTQLLENPTLVWDKQPRSITYDPGDTTPLKRVNTEAPTDWDFQHVDHAARPNQTAESYHEDPAGMRISTGYIPFEAGYVQVVEIPANTRLLAKVTYTLTSDPATPGGNPPTINGHFVISGDTEARMNAGNLRGSTEQTYVFSSPKAGEVRLGWFASDQYGDSITNLVVHSIELIVVAADYGGVHIDTVIPYGMDIPAPQPIPTPTPTPVPSPTPGGARITFSFDGTPDEFLSMVRSLFAMVGAIVT